MKLWLTTPESLDTIRAIILLQRMLQTEKGLKMAKTKRRKQRDIRPLTQTQIRAAKPGDFLPDGGGLYLNVAEGGSKSWIAYLTIKGIGRKKRSIGPVALFTPAEARRKMVEYRQAAVAGIDPKPRKSKEVSAIPTFGEAAPQALAWIRNVKKWKTEITPQGWKDLDRLAMPRLGNLRVNEIESTDILSILDPIWNAEKDATAKKLLTAIKQVFAWSTEYKHIKSNPVNDITTRKSNEDDDNHRPSIPYSEMGDALKAIRQSGKGKENYQLAASCLEFIILSGVRCNAARGAKWDEIDLDARVWNLPGDRQKNDKLFPVPLSKQAVKLLSRVWIDTGGSEYVFPASRNGGYMSDYNMNAIIRENGLKDEHGNKATIHGCRASIGTWAEESGDYSDSTISMMLSHDMKGKAKKTRRAYLRSVRYDERAEIHQAWADYISA